MSNLLFSIATVLAFLTISNTGWGTHLSSLVTGIPEWKPIPVESVERISEPEPIVIGTLQSGSPAFVISENIIESAVEMTLGVDITSVSIDHQSSRTYLIATSDNLIWAIELEVDGMDIVCKQMMDSHTCTGNQTCTCCKFKRDGQDIIGCECNDYPGCTGSMNPYCTHTVSTSSRFLEILHQFLN